MFQQINGTQSISSFLKEPSIPNKSACDLGLPGLLLSSVLYLQNIDFCEGAYSEIVGREEGYFSLSKKGGGFNTLRELKKTAVKVRP